MVIDLRQELPSDYEEVEALIKEAFRDDPIGDHTEHLLVRKSRKSKAFIPELSIIAESNGKILGHILLSKIKITNKKDVFNSLSLAPVSVLPDYQNLGIGSKLILKCHELAKDLGFKSIILLGHAEYYPRFGYTRASAYDISLPFGAPDENCMAIELDKGGLKGVNGMVIYPPEFH